MTGRKLAPYAGLEPEHCPDSMCPTNTSGAKLRMIPLDEQRRYWRCYHCGEELDVAIMARTRKKHKTGSDLFEDPSDD